MVEPLHRRRTSGLPHSCRASETVCFSYMATPSDSGALTGRDHAGLLQGSSMLPTSPGPSGFAFNPTPAANICTIPGEFSLSWPSIIL